MDSEHAGCIRHSEHTDALVNGGCEISGAALTVARRNARRMIRQGYQWAICGIGRIDGICEIGGGCDPREAELPQPQVGTVHTPVGNTYTVWLPGIIPLYPEGWCSCPFFRKNAICKHLYFAVEATVEAMGHAPLSWREGETRETAHGLASRRSVAAHQGLCRP